MRQYRANLLIYLVLTASLMVAVPALSWAQGQSIDSIVAVVDEDVILRSELDQAVDSVVSRIEARGGNSPPTNMLERQVLENLVVTRLEVQRALQTGIRVSDADIDQALIQVASQNNLNVDQLRATIERDGFDFTEFRRSIGEDILSQRLRQRVIDSGVNISETEIDILLESQDLSGGEYNLSTILVALPDGATPEAIAIAADEAQDIHRRLGEGLDFTAAAISYSDARNALDGGNIGWVDLNSIPRQLADAIDSLSPGQFTSPIRAPEGFYLLHVNDYREQRQVMVEEFHARHIMIEVNELVSPQQATDTITDIKRRLEEGEDFAELAKQHSDDPTSANIGGDMGWFPPNAYGTRVELTLNALEDNQISEPFQSNVGWHVVQRLGRRTTDRTTEAIRDEAKEKIHKRKAEAELDKFQRQIRNEAYVDIRLDS